MNEEIVRKLLNNKESVDDVMIGLHLILAYYQKNQTEILDFDRAFIRFLGIVRSYETCKGFLYTATLKKFFAQNYLTIKP